MKNKNKKVCKICGNIIANPDNKTGICPRCSEKGKKIGGTVFSLAGFFIFLKELMSKYKKF